MFDVRFTLAQRIKVARDIANALAHLHGQNPPFIVRNLDPHYIMLDMGFEAKLFDLALGTGGTFGDRVTDYSPFYGANGHVVVENELIDEWAIEKYKKDKNIVDKCLQECSGELRTFYSKDASKIAKIAIRCVSPAPEDRPNITAVVRVLDGLHLVKCANHVQPSSDCMGYESVWIVGTASFDNVICMGGKGVNIAGKNVKITRFSDRTINVLKVLRSTMEDSVDENWTKVIHDESLERSENERIVDPLLAEAPYEGQHFDTVEDARLWMVTTRTQARDSRIQRKMEELRIRCFGYQPLNLPTLIPHGLWLLTEEAVTTKDEVAGVRPRESHPRVRELTARQLACDKIVEEDVRAANGEIVLFGKPNHRACFRYNWGSRKAQILECHEKFSVRFKPNTPASKFFVSSSSEESSSLGRGNECSVMEVTVNNVGTTLEVGEPSIAELVVEKEDRKEKGRLLVIYPEGVDIGKEYLKNMKKLQGDWGSYAEDQGLWFRDYISGKGEKIIYYQVPCLEKWKKDKKGVMNVLQYCHAQLNGNVYEMMRVCKALNKKWRKEWTAKQFEAEEVLKFYKWKYIEARSKPKPSATPDRMSLFDCATRDLNELKLVLSELGIRRHKRVDSVVPRLQRAQEKQAMAEKKAAKAVANVLSPLLPPPQNTTRVTRKIAKVVPGVDEKLKVSLSASEEAEKNSLKRKHHSEEGSHQTLPHALSKMRELEKKFCLMARTDPQQLEDEYLEHTLVRARQCLDKMSHIFGALTAKFEAYSAHIKDLEIKLSLKKEMRAAEATTTAIFFGVLSKHDKLMTDSVTACLIELPSELEEEEIVDDVAVLPEKMSDPPLGDCKRGLKEAYVELSKERGVVPDQARVMFLAQEVRNRHSLEAKRIRKYQIKVQKQLEGELKGFQDELLPYEEQNLYAARQLSKEVAIRMKVKADVGALVHDRMWKDFDVKNAKAENMWFIKELLAELEEEGKNVKDLQFQVNWLDAARVDMRARAHHAVLVRNLDILEYLAENTRLPNLNTSLEEDLLKASLELDNRKTYNHYREDEVEWAMSLVGQMDSFMTVLEDQNADMQSKIRQVEERDAHLKATLMEAQSKLSELILCKQVKIEPDSVHGRKMAAVILLFASEF
ncbi:hypothetical protein GIB67_012685 [Kingdonia uniflora]|uniref:Protein kinase domain-containing protein n=1 Tax=Kingdonia uniflora TaxID=39325 RepID=A0A7J7NFZ3_9MAGN|nr:hypothetical protein GIB67_012685 [Kingdonia uniflora]